MDQSSLILARSPIIQKTNLRMWPKYDCIACQFYVEPEPRQCILIADLTSDKKKTEETFN